jgi:hypothetical protein
MVHFIGVANPKGEHDSKNGFLLTESEIKKQQKELANRPILYDHDGINTTTGSLNHDKIIGTVVASWKDPVTGSLIALGKVFPKNKIVQEKQIIENMKNGKLKGLSLGIEHSLSQDVQVVGKKFRELSVTEEGALPDTFIHSVYEEDPIKKGKILGFINAYNKEKELKKIPYKSIETHVEQPKSHSSQDFLKAISVHSKSRVMSSQQAPVPANTAPESAQAQPNNKRKAESDPQPPQAETKEVTNEEPTAEQQKKVLDKLTALESLGDSNNPNIGAMIAYIEANKQKELAKLRKIAEVGISHVENQLKKQQKDPKMEQFAVGLKRAVDSGDINSLPILKYLTVAAKNASEQEKSIIESNRLLEEERKRVLALQAEFELLKQKDSLRSQAPHYPKVDVYSNQKITQQPQTQTQPPVQNTQSPVQNFMQRWNPSATPIYDAKYKPKYIPHRSGFVEKAQASNDPHVREALEIFNSTSVGVGIDRDVWKEHAGKEFKPTGIPRSTLDNGDYYVLPNFM